MKKKRFWKLEYSLTLFVVFIVVLLLIPTSIQSTLQADLITRWNDCFENISFMRDAMDKHEKENMLIKLKQAKNKAEREKIITLIIKPYFRLAESKYLKHYHPKYLNGNKVKQGDEFYFSELYNGDRNIIVGIKDIKDMSQESAMFMMMFDVNGIIPPNTWGKDIFGVKVYDDKIIPIGESMSMDELKSDCSLTGTGVSCSYYYHIGGSFIE